MKVYRVVPNCFFTGKKLDNSGKISLESLYYKMGYTSFSSKVKRDDYNSLNCKNYQGKFFYLFAEDAVFEGSSLINGYHRLRADICSILEYDIPEDMIIKHMWPVTPQFPKSKEGFILTFIDKHCALAEAIKVLKKNIHKKKVWRYAYIFFAMIILKINKGNN